MLHSGGACHIKNWPRGGHIKFVHIQCRLHRVIHFFFISISHFEMKLGAYYFELRFKRWLGDAYTKLHVIYKKHL